MNEKDICFYSFLDLYQCHNNNANQKDDENRNSTTKGSNVTYRESIKIDRNGRNILIQSLNASKN